MMGHESMPLSGANFWKHIPQKTTFANNIKLFLEIPEAPHAFGRRLKLNLYHRLISIIMICNVHQTLQASMENT